MCRSNSSKNTFHSKNINYKHSYKRALSTEKSTATSSTEAMYRPLMVQPAAQTSSQSSLQTLLQKLNLPMFSLRWLPFASQKLNSWVFLVQIHFQHQHWNLEVVWKVHVYFLYFTQYFQDGPLPGKMFCPSERNYK